MRVAGYVATLARSTSGYLNFFVLADAAREALAQYRQVRVLPYHNLALVAYDADLA